MLWVVVKKNTSIKKSQKNQSQMIFAAKRSVSGSQSLSKMFILIASDFPISQHVWLAL